MIVSGWWLTYPSEKNISSSVGMMTFPIYGKTKHVPNHEECSDIVNTHAYNIMLVLW